MAPMATTDDLLEVNTLLASGQVLEALAQLPKPIVHFNAHERGPLPCLCKRCVDSIGEVVRVRDTDFILDAAIGGRHFLLYWVPIAIRSDRAQIRQRVATQLRSR